MSVTAIFGSLAGAGACSGTGATGATSGAARLSLASSNVGADGDIDVDVDVDAAADDLVEAAEDPVLEEEPVVAEELPPEEESLDVNEADETAALTGEEPEKEPIQELEATVDKVDHIVQRVETYIAVTEDSGLTTDDVQAMAASNESFAAIRDLGRLSKTVKRTANAEIISAYHRLTCLSLRNIGKAIQ